MFQRLVNHNNDIRRLVEEGHHRNGAFVTKLVFIDQNRVAQEDHQVFFAGGHPCQLDGTPIANLAGGTTQLTLSEKCSDVVVERSFSNKPKVEGKFSDFFAKIESYTGIISGPAIERYGKMPYTFRVDSTVLDNSVFKFQDTLTSRAEITDLAIKFENEVVAVFGLGGTGAYLLDFLVKTPVREIRAFDLDGYHVHNAFRSPGKLDPNELGKSKAEVYQSRYENFRHGLRIVPEYVDATSSEAIDGITFAFVCVDKGSSRAGIFELLINKGIPFIDVGMGLSRKQDALTGMARMTYYPSDSGAKMRDLRLAELNDGPDDLYQTNIQIAELNALNASLAIIRYKQLRGFYFEELSNLHLLFGIDDLKIAGESNFDED
jgi:hypothetical protein